MCELKKMEDIILDFKIDLNTLSQKLTVFCKEFESFRNKQNDLFNKVIETRNKIRNGWQPSINNNEKKCFILPKLFEVLVLDLKSWEYTTVYHSYLLAFKDMEQVKNFRELITDKEIMDFFYI